MFLQLELRYSSLYKHINVLLFLYSRIIFMIIKFFMKFFHWSSAEHWVLTPRGSFLLDTSNQFQASLLGVESVDSLFCLFFKFCVT